MKFLALLLLSFSAAAAPPPVWPNEAGSAGHAVVSMDGTACSVTWFYEVNHRWIRAGFYGNGDDCNKLRPEIMADLGLDVNDLPSWMLTAGVAIKMASMTHEQKDAMWNKVFTLHEGDPGYAENVVADAYARILWEAVPTPTHAPPSGWVTQTTIAYKRGDAIGSNVLTPAGTVPLGAPCKSYDTITNAIGTYHALVDRNQAVMTKVGNYTVPRPTTIYVKCLP